MKTMKEVKKELNKSRNEAVAKLIVGFRKSNNFEIFKNKK